MKSGTLVILVTLACIIFVAASVCLAKPSTSLGSLPTATPQPTATPIPPVATATPAPTATPIPPVATATPQSTAVIIADESSCTFGSINNPYTGTTAANVCTVTLVWDNAKNHRIAIYWSKYISTNARTAAIGLRRCTTGGTVCSTIHEATTSGGDNLGLTNSTTIPISMTTTVDILPNNTSTHAAPYYAVVVNNSTTARALLPTTGSDGGLSSVSGIDTIHVRGINSGTNAAMYIDRIVIWEY